MDTWVWIVIAAAAVVLVLLAVGLLAARKRRTSQLREGFGPEYDRTVEDMGSRRKADRTSPIARSGVRSSTSGRLLPAAATASPTVGATSRSGSSTTQARRYARRTSSWSK